ncbi:hypothetical protein Pcinc_041380 [Petrolisthes cinctipes]|uniref:Uncharacterized protein n=1 Tax=Petrolisthes cinctipes TaxID=88211 RepID=A0AAE1EHV2_PETCI|nr:hypothetical protein Pcinc_041380 [Petrolisthes cinctipes]
MESGDDGVRVEASHRPHQLLFSTTTTTTTAAAAAPGSVRSPPSTPTTRPELQPPAPPPRPWLTHATEPPTTPPTPVTPHLPQPDIPVAPLLAPQPYPHSALKNTFLLPLATPRPPRRPCVSRRALRYQGPSIKVPELPSLSEHVHRLSPEVRQHLQTSLRLLQQKDKPVNPKDTPTDPKQSQREAQKKDCAVWISCSAEDTPATGPDTTPVLNRIDVDHTLGSTRRASQKSRTNSITSDYFSDHEFLHNLDLVDEELQTLETDRTTTTPACRGPHLAAPWHQEQDKQQLSNTLQRKYHVDDLTFTNMDDNKGLSVGVYGSVGGIAPLSFSLSSLSGSSSPVLECLSPARTPADLHTNSLNRRRSK